MIIQCSSFASLEKEKLPFGKNAVYLCYNFESKEKKEEKEILLKSLNDYSKITFIDLILKDKKEIEKEILKADDIYIPGGNTFILQKIVFEKCYDVLNKVYKKGKNIIGASAGAHILSPTILFSIFADKNETKLSLSNLDELKGLNFTNKCIKPHINESETIKNKIYELMAKEFNFDEFYCLCEDEYVATSN